MLLKLARGGDHADHGFHRIHVGAFQRTGHHGGVGVGGQIALGVAEQAVIATLQGLLQIRGHHLQATDVDGVLPIQGGHHSAVAAKADLGVLRDIQRCATIGQHGQAGGSHQLAIGRDFQRAVAGVGL